MPKTNGTGVPRSPDITRDLKKLLGAAEGRASGWLQQREVIARELTTIRDTAQKLLSNLIDGNASRKAGKIDGPLGPRRPGRRPGFKLSAAARRKISRAATKRWAARKAKQSKSA